MKKIDKNVVVCILARDCKSALKRNIPQIEKLCGFFSDSKIIDSMRFYGDTWTYMEIYGTGSKLRCLISFSILSP